MRSLSLSRGDIVFASGVRERLISTPHPTLLIVERL